MMKKKHTIKRYSHTDEYGMGTTTALIGAGVFLLIYAIFSLVMAGVESNREEKKRINNERQERFMESRKPQRPKQRTVEGYKVTY